jgi:hypothetical protein
VCTITSKLRARGENQSDTKISSNKVESSFGLGKFRNQPKYTAAKACESTPQGGREDHDEERIGGNREEHRETFRNWKRSGLQAYKPKNSITPRESLVREDEGD